MSQTAQLPDLDQPPDVALVYLAHTTDGVSMRELSRRLGVHPSTVHRQVRRIEEKRDDPLFDEALAKLDHRFRSGQEPTPFSKEPPDMSLCKPSVRPDPENQIQSEARRILRRLCETKSFLAVAPEAEMAVVFRETVPGRTRQTATVGRDVAREFALRDWISCRRAGKVACYEITAAGRAALDRMLGEDAIHRRDSAGFAEMRTPFTMQHQEEALRTVMTREGGATEQIRVNLTESPLAWLARRSGPKGEAFLGIRELEAGERLREDFERAELGPRMAQNWDRFLTAGTEAATPVDRGRSDGPSSARNRVAEAMKALGPGLSDIAFRCCCFLEGLEVAEKRLGWSKRSGKVVLRIALQRLADHYGIGTRGGA